MSAPSLAASHHKEDTALPTGQSNISCVRPSLSVFCGSVEAMLTPFLQVLHGIDDVRFEDLPVPTECGDDE